MADDCEIQNTDTDNLNKILLAIDNKENIILYGAGGCGKTHAIRLLAEYIQGQNQVVCCTATTGVAAINLNVPDKKISGTTLHSWAGVGLATEVAKKLYTKVYYDEQARKRWIYTDVLIIDEVSMLGADFLDKLDFIGKTIRNQKDKPFGGIQLIFSGDFLQLPPVNEEWSFRSIAWKELNLVPFIFDQPKRYDDVDYFSLLLRVREGKQNPEDIKKLKARVRAHVKLVKALEEATGSNIIKPTILYSKKVDVSFHNNQELDKLPGKTIEYIADDKFIAYNNNAKYDHYIRKLEDATPKSLALKIGAQVMLKCNLDVKGGLVNGSRGVILEMESEYVYVRFISGIKIRIKKHTWEIEDKDGKASRSQIPFILSWSLTIHKCVNENTLISTNSGMMRIGSLSSNSGWTEKKISIDTLNGVESTSQVFKGEIENSIIITTKMGYSIEGSVRHPVLVKTPDRAGSTWKILPDIKIDDVVFLHRGSCCKATEKIKFPSINKIGNKIDVDIAYVFGLLIGGGNQKNGIIELQSDNEDVMDDFERIVRDKFNIRLLSCKNRLYFFNTVVLATLVELGVNCSVSQNKHVPWSILQSPQDVQRSFLRGLIDVTPKCENTKSLISSSENLIKEVHILLLSLGVISKRSKLNNGTWGLKITEEHKVLSGGNGPTFFIDSVETITYGECQMYDVEVPGSHSFISNGIVSHNSQGSTLDYAICDLGPNVFACGQAYVALSRVRNLKGLFISEFYPTSIKASKTALKYSRELEKIQKLYTPKEKLEEDSEEEDFEFLGLNISE